MTDPQRDQTSSLHRLELSIVKLESMTSHIQQTVSDIKADAAAHQASNSASIKELEDKFEKRMSQFEKTIDEFRTVTIQGRFGLALFVFLGTAVGTVLTIAVNWSRLFGKGAG